MLGLRKSHRNWWQQFSMHFSCAVWASCSRLAFTPKAEPPLGSGLDSAAVVNSVRSDTAAAVGEMNLDAFKTEEGNCIYFICHWIPRAYHIILLDISYINKNIIQEGQWSIWAECEQKLLLWWNYGDLWIFRPQISILFPSELVRIRATSHPNQPPKRVKYKLVANY